MSDNRSADTGIPSDKHGRLSCFGWATAARAACFGTKSTCEPPQAWFTCLVAENVYPSNTVRGVWLSDWPWLIAQVAVLVAIGVGLSLWLHNDWWVGGLISAVLYAITIRFARRDWVPPSQG